jgi:hypothetical protein
MCGTNNPLQPVTFTMPLNPVHLTTSCTLNRVQNFHHLSAKSLLVHGWISGPVHIHFILTVQLNMLYRTLFCFANFGSFCARKNILNNEDCIKHLTSSVQTQSLLGLREVWNPILQINMSSACRCSSCVAYELRSALFPPLTRPDYFLHTFSGIL